MPQRAAPRSADLRGATRLAIDATAGLTDLVEALHARIARVPGLSAPAPDERTGGITGLVYRTIRGVTRLTGGSLDALLALTGVLLGPQGPPSAEREAIVAALNGVLGDHLVASANPLAIAMSLRREGRALPLNTAPLAERLPDPGGRLLVLAHGLCMNDLQWSREGHDHGAALARDLGFTPIYLHYNSGQHVSLNGRELAGRLEQLLDHWPRPLERFALIGHSMGGLLARSALHYAGLAGHRWPVQLSDLVFLGTPHHGAPLERAGHWIDLLLGAAPYAAPFARLGKLRSAGITDLRHGNLTDEDWHGQDRFAHAADRRQHVPLPAGVRCFAAGASIGERNRDLKDRLLGDGLVPLDSALGRHRDPARALAFAADRQWVGYGINHMELLSSPAVYDQVRGWLARP